MCSLRTKADVSEKKDPVEEIAHLLADGLFSFITKEEIKEAENEHVNVR